MAFKFRLVDEVGNDLGLFVTGQSDWQLGHQILRGRGRGPVLEVIRLVDAAEGDNVNGYLIVRATYRPVQAGNYR